MKDMPKKYHLTLKINFPKGQLLLFIVSFIYWWRKFFSHESEYHMTEIVKVGRTDEIKKREEKNRKKTSWPHHFDSEDYCLPSISHRKSSTSPEHDLYSFICQNGTYLWKEPNSIFGYVSLLMFRYENSMSHPTSSFMVQNK